MFSVLFVFGVVCDCIDMCLGGCRFGDRLRRRVGVFCSRLYFRFGLVLLNSVGYVH